MMLITIAETVVGIAIAFFVALMILRARGYRIEFKVKPIKGRRRRPIEPDEHTQFL